MLNTRSPDGVGHSLIPYRRKQEIYLIMGFIHPAPLRHPLSPVRVLWTRARPNTSLSYPKQGCYPQSD